MFDGNLWPNSFEQPSRQNEILEGNTEIEDKSSKELEAQIDNSHCILQNLLVGNDIGEEDVETEDSMSSQEHKKLDHDKIIGWSKMCGKCCIIFQSRAGLLEEVQGLFCEA